MSVDERLHHVQTKAPLVLDEIDFTMHDPAGVAADLAAPLEYAQRVEAAVVASGIEMLMPNRDARIDEFLVSWTANEQGHARALGELMRRLRALDRPAFSRTVRALAGRNWEESIAAPVQRVAERLLVDGNPLRPFVRDAIATCLASEPDGAALLAAGAPPD
jgi:hypothetical protein